MNKKFIFLAMVVCLLAFVAVIAFSQTGPNVRWEYTEIQINIDQANSLGREGWELVTESSGWWVFKRRLP